MYLSPEQTKRVVASLAVAVLLGVTIGALLLMPPLEQGVPASGDVIDELGGRPVYAFSFPETPTPELRRPVSVIVSGGRVYVVDSAAGVVRVFDERGQERSVIGSGTLGTPVYIARDAARGVLYVTDRQRRALVSFTDEGEHIGEVVPRSAAATPSVEATPWAPLGVAVDEQGLLYVTDVAKRHRLLVLKRDGIIVREIAGEQQARTGSGVVLSLEYPNAVDVVADEIWVADSNNRRVVVFGRDGEFRRVITMPGMARGLDFISSEESTRPLVAVVDTLAQDVAVLDATGTVRGTFGEPGAGAGGLAFPNDVAVSADGTRLYVADTGNRRVQVWDIVPAPSARGPEGEPAETSARGRVPYVATAIVSGLVALLIAGVTASAWWRERRVRQEGGPASEETDE